MNKTKVIKLDSGFPDINKIEEAAQIVRSGGIVAFPTETVYGLAASINDSLAVEKLRMIKKRPEEKKFSVCIYSFSQVEQFVESIPPLAYRLIKRFWPGPLTLILKSKAGEMIGLRMPDHLAALLFLQAVGVPVYAPSANFSGEKAPTTAEEVLSALDGRIDAVIDSGKTHWAIASTVCQVNDDGYQILREGAINQEMIKSAAKDKDILFVCTGNSCRSAMAEGIMRDMVKHENHIQVSSAGIAAYEGMPASREAVTIMHRQGIDISGHSARRLTEDMIKKADYILVMEAGHKRYITEHFPYADKRVFLLKEFLPENDGGLNISDPIGMGMEFYDRVAQTIRKAIEGLVLKIK